MRAYITDEVVVKVVNKPGVLHSLSKDIGGKGINIEVVNAYAVGDVGIVRIITPDPNTAVRVLEKNPYSNEVKVGQAFIVELENKPGELAKLTEKLYKRGVDLEVVYIASRGGDKTQVVIKPAPEHFEKAREVMEEEV